MMKVLLKEVKECNNCCFNLTIKGTELLLCRKHYDEYKKGIKVN